MAAVAVFAVATVVLVRRELRASLDTALSQRAQDVAELAVSAPAVLTEPGALDDSGSAVAALRSGRRRGAALGSSRV